MRFLSLITSLVLLVGLTSATCTTKNMRIRKEWRTLKKSEKLKYINAVKCLMAKPAQTGAYFAGAKTRYDDFLALHINSTDYVHFNGPFLPWHRWLMYLYESELINTCGYKGTQPYWDFSLDNTVESFPNSPLFDTVYGFGGNGPYIADVSSDIIFPVKTPTIIPGRTGGGCLDNGPFANLTGNMGMAFNLSYNPHCVRRDFSPTLVASALSDTNIALALNAPTFNDLNTAIQGHSFAIPDITLHGGLHIGIGGQVSDQADMYSSPTDPLFYFIHSSLDKMWNQWQRSSWATRKSEIAGPIEMFAYPFNYFGDFPYTNVTLDYEMQFLHFGPNVKIRDVMDIEAANLCYTYV